MSQQVKIRRGTAAQVAAATPVEGELAYATDTKRLSIGDGVTVGGTPLAKVSEIADVSTLAPKDSPALTGNPTAPTPSPGDNDTSIATTGFVKDATDTAISSLRGGVGASFDTLVELYNGLKGLGDLTLSAGDMLYASGANTLTRLAKGAAAQVLVMNAGATAPEWGAGGGGGAEVGVIEDYAGHTVPAKWLLAFGQNVSRTTYSALFAALTRSSAVTMTIASPGVITWAAHGLKVGDPVSFTTTGALPTGVVAGTTYFVHAVIDANSFRLTASVGGSVINTSGSQSGVHTALYAPWGRGDGSTTFGLPDARGRVSAGRDDMGGTSANRLTGLSGGVDGDFMGNVGGAETHTLTLAQLASHTHTYGIYAPGGGVTQPITGGSSGAPAGYTTSSAGSDAAHNNVQPTFIVNKMIYAGV